MLVIISDLHLTDGTSGTTISERAFRVFSSRLRDLAYDASWRADGRYKPIEQIDVLLLGDILDVIRSTQWGRNGPGLVRPWHDWRTGEWKGKFEGKVAEITRGILATNSASLQILKDITKDGTITVPAEKAGRPDDNAGWEPNANGRKPVTVRLHYMVGNHDWFFHLPGEAFDKIRAEIVEAMGLSNNPKQPFPHEPEASEKIDSLFREHKMFARHGDIYDAFNFEGERAASSLGDAIVVDLLNQFPDIVKSELKPTGRLKDVDPEVAVGLREIDNVRPLLLVPVWIDGLLSRLCRDNRQIKAVKDLWNDVVDGFLGMDFVKSRDSRLNPWDNVDKLQTALRFSKGVSLDSASKMLAWVSGLGLAHAGSYREAALAETAFKNRSARFVVYGHTHHHEIVPLDVSWGKSEIQQLYINSGTWRRVYELAQLNTKDEEFIGYDVMTYLAFFKGDERGGRPFESWSGALGV